MSALIIHETVVIKVAKCITLLLENLMGTGQNLYGYHSDRSKIPTQHMLKTHHTHLRRHENLQGRKCEHILEGILQLALNIMQALLPIA